MSSQAQELQFQSPQQLSQILSPEFLKTAANFDKEAHRVEDVKKLWEKIAPGLIQIDQEKKSEPNVRINNGLRFIELIEKAHNNAYEKCYGSIGTYNQNTIKYEAIVSLQERADILSKNGENFDPAKEETLMSRIRESAPELYSSIQESKEEFSDPMHLSRTCARHAKSAQSANELALQELQFTQNICDSYMKTGHITINDLEKLAHHILSQISWKA